MNEVTIFETDLQNKIATLLISGLEPQDVVKKLSCTEQTVYVVKNHSRFAQFCYNSAMQRLMTEGAIAAVDCLIEVVKDKKAAKATRTSAADKLLHYTGLRVTISGTVEQSPANMTQEEIHLRLQALQGEAANRAKSVTIEGDSTEIDINNLL